MEVFILLNVFFLKKFASLSARELKGLISAAAAAAAAVAWRAGALAVLRDVTSQPSLSR